MKSFTLLSPPPPSAAVTKRELVCEISEQTGLTRTQVFDMLRLFMENITGHLAAGDEVVLRNFGTFEVRVTRPKTGRNPRIPEKDVPIPERSVVKFTPGKVMRERILELSPARTRATSAAGAPG